MAAGEGADIHTVDCTVPAEEEIAGRRAAVEVAVHTFVAAVVGRRTRAVVAVGRSSLGEAAGIDIGPVVGIRATEALDDNPRAMEAFADNPRAMEAFVDILPMEGEPVDSFRAKKASDDRPPEAAVGAGHNPCEPVAAFAAVDPRDILRQQFAASARVGATAAAAGQVDSGVALEQTALDCPLDPTLQIDSLEIVQLWHPKSELGRVDKQATKPQILEDG